MKQQAEVFKLHENRQGAGEHFAQRTHRQGDFNRRLDDVVQRFLEQASQRGFDQPADEDYAMRWAVAHYLRTQSMSAKGEHHVAA
jgi:hypothetical protein